MARQPRFVATMQPHLLSQSALDGIALFRDQSDFIHFLALLKDSAKINSVAIHAYALLESQLLLVATPSEGQSLSKMMQWIGRRYVPWYNQKYRRSGSLWHGRFKAAVLEAQTHLLAACQFTEESPVRASLCFHPSDYPWSSYGAHTGGARALPLADPPAYWALGNTPFEREMAYQRRMEQALSKEEQTQFERCLKAGLAIGTPAFALALQNASGHRLVAGRRGRPPRNGATSAPSMTAVSPFNEVEQKTKL